MMFIVFEGIDGSGKTTALRFLAEKLGEHYEVVTTREPGGTAFAEKIRSLLNEFDLDEQTRLLLLFAARKNHVEQVIKPALQHGKIVLCDRFVDSSFAYQGINSDIGHDKVKILVDNFVGIKPDLTIFLKIELEEALERMKNERENPLLLLEKAYSKQFNDINNYYNSYYKGQDSKYVEIIDANQDFCSVKLELKRIAERIHGKKNTCMARE